MSKRYQAYWTHLGLFGPNYGKFDIPICIGTLFDLNFDFWIVKHFIDGLDQLSAVSVIFEALLVRGKAVMNVTC